MDASASLTPRPTAPMPLLVAMMVASQVAITIFLPSMPAMAEALGTSQAAVQIIIPAYLGAFRRGPIGDRPVVRRGRPARSPPDRLNAFLPPPASPARWPPPLGS